MHRVAVLTATSAVVLTVAGSLANAQDFDDLFGLFEVGAALLDGDAFDVDGAGPTATSVTGVVGGETYTITAPDGQPIRDYLNAIPSQTAADVLINGDLVQLSTDAANFDAAGAGSVTRIIADTDDGRVDTSVDGALGDLDDPTTVTGTFNGERFQLDFPAGTELGDIGDDTPITVSVNGDEIYSGTAGALEDDDLAQAALASSLNLLDPITNLNYGAQQVHSGLALGIAQTRVATVFGMPGGTSGGGVLAAAAGPSFTAAPDQQLAMLPDAGRSLVGIAQSAQTVPSDPARRAATGDVRGAVWGDVAYASYDNDNPRYRAEGDVVGARVGADAVVFDTILIGAAVGFDTIDVDGGPSGRNHLSIDALSVSPYVAASLFDGLIVPEVVANYSTLDVETRSARGTAAAASGSSDGYSASIRGGLSVNQPFMDDSVIASLFGGVQAGYQAIDGFVNSRGVRIDLSESPMGEAEIGGRVTARLVPSVVVSGAAAYVFDFSDQFTENQFLEDLSDDYVELGGRLTWETTDAISVWVGGSTKLDLDDREEYVVHLNASWRF